MAETKKYAPGEVIFREGAWEMNFHEVISGTVGIYAGWGTEKQRLLTEVGEGGLFGEMGMLESRPRSATAAALTEAETRVVGNDDFETFLKEHPDKVLGILRSMTARTRALSDEYLDTCREIAALPALSEKEGLAEKLRGLFRR